MRIRSIMKAAVTIAAALTLFAGCAKIKEVYGKLGQDKPKEDAPAEATVFAVNTTTAVKGQIADYIALSGDIVAGSTVDTYSDAAGKVTRLYVDIGDMVKKGQRIAQVDPSKPGMTYVPADATAPVGGTVVALPAQVGMTISQAVPLARIAAGSALEIELYVAERFISKIKMGLPCEITLDAYPGEKFRGTVSEVSPVVDPASRTMEIKVNVDNPGQRLKAGMFAKVRVITAQHDGIVKIPSGAMVSRFGEDYVFTIAPDPGDPNGRIVKKTVIKPGIQIDGVMEVQSGLVPDQEFVVRGQTLLEDGAKINVIDKVAPLAASAGADPDAAAAN